MPRRVIQNSAEITRIPDVPLCESQKSQRLLQIKTPGIKRRRLWADGEVWESHSIRQRARGDRAGCNLGSPDVAFCNAGLGEWIETGRV